MIKGDCKIHYQVHIQGGNWLGDITGYNENDSTYGYAGILGKTIDGIRMWVEEEKVKTPTTTTTTTTTAPAKKYYRVRTSWLNVSSQKGAYTNLNHAIECCQFAGKGYKVFDWNGKVVYEYKVTEVKVSESTSKQSAPKTEDNKVINEVKQSVTEVTPNQNDVKPNSDKVVDETTPTVPKVETNTSDVETSEPETPVIKKEDVKSEPKVSIEVTPTIDNSNDNVKTDTNNVEVNQDDKEKVAGIMDIVTKVINFIVSLFKKN
jgi:hypothetical protein